MAKLTEEEKILREAEREKRREEKLLLKTKLPPKPEQQIIEEYANQVIDRKMSRGHYDSRFKWHQNTQTTQKDLWMDVDFYFCVVFQSAAQKYQFLKALAERLGVEILEREQVKIINGLELSEKMGIPVTKELPGPSPYPDLELSQFALDSEEF